MTADGVSVYLVDDHGTKVLQVSPANFPNMVREAVNKIQIARAVLGDTLASVIPAALDEWEIGGISCALFEAFKPLSPHPVKRFFQLNRIRSPLLAWLRQTVEIDRGPAKQVHACLQALSQCPFPLLSAAADNVLERIERGHHTPRARVMHGDLTLGNVLLDPSRIRDFMIIDWRGSEVDGFPIFDLVKLAESLRLSRRDLRTELALHCERLGCELPDTRSYLVAALGHIWLNIEQFPPERFSEMATDNLKTLDRALNG